MKRLLRSKLILSVVALVMISAAAVTLPAAVMHARAASSDPSCPLTLKPPQPGPPLRLLSCDPYTNLMSQHRTEVEPDTFAFGNTIVAAFQVGRNLSFAASNIGWATSTNGGRTWTQDFLPATTVNATPPGRYLIISDPSVAYDTEHKVWIISYLGAMTYPPSASVDVLVSRSTDGGLTWDNPVTVNNSGNFNDKNWTVCDDTASSPFYGHCYTEWDDISRNSLIQMSTSSDGGRTWGPAKPTTDEAHGADGQPLVQPNGTVIIPIDDQISTLAFTSTNGGRTWSATNRITSIYFHQPDGGPSPGRLRASLSPSAEIDASGKVYVVWSDCRYEPECSTRGSSNPNSVNDLVMSTSTNGTTWSSVQRIPIDRVGSGVDHFIPGLAVDRSTSGGSAHLGLAYYYFPTGNCPTDTCQLDVGFISSTNGGASWSSAQHLAGPMKLTWLANTSKGRMVGDYISTSFLFGRAFPVFAIATAPSRRYLHEAIFTVARGLR